MMDERQMSSEELRKWAETLPSVQRFRKAVREHDEWQQRHEERILKSLQGPIICTKDHPCEHCAMNKPESA